jgi:hypothetical protein
MSGVALAFGRARRGARPSPCRVPVPHALPADAPAPRGRHVLLIGGMTWLLTVLMIAPEGFDYSLIEAQFGPISGGLLSRLLWILLLTCGVTVVVRRSRRAASLLRHVNPFLLLFVALVAASVLWSIEPR